ncbi:MAG: 3-deoxy-D-manno-octulosonic acid transferase [Limisphaerales bacterium]
MAYNILFALFFWCSAPWYFLKMWRRGDWRIGFWQRFGRYGPEITAALDGRPVLWLHAVSVGEVGICLQLIRVLGPRLPGLQMAVSTTTSTGMGELRRKLPPSIPRFYYPVDFPGAARRALNTFRPRALILVEAEIWPNLLWQALERKVDLFLVNARLSERSFRNYGRFGRLFRPIFSQFRAAGCQEANDAARLTALGFAPENVRVVGNLKFDAAQPEPRGGLDVRALLRQISVRDQAKILVAGSTHAGEEAVLADMLARLRRRCPDLFLILVPRHFERAKEVGQELAARGVSFVYRSEIGHGPGRAAEPPQCLLVNSTGELKFFYEVADVVFVGKSLTAQGGQNPIEPAALGKAIVLGPNMQNFTSMVRAFLAKQAVLQVPDAAALESALADLLADGVRRAELGARALAVVRENLGATERTVEFLLNRLGG